MRWDAEHLLKEVRRNERTAYEYFSPEYQAGWLLEVDVDVTGADLDSPVPESAFPTTTETHQTALAGYRAPRHGVGAGLWIARQLTWRVDFRRDPEGFTARVTL